MNRKEASLSLLSELQQNIENIVQKGDFLGEFARFLYYMFMMMEEEACILDAIMYRLLLYINMHKVPQ